MATQCKAHMEFIDTTALADSTPTSSSGGSISDLSLLSTEESYDNYGYPDLNCFILDGSRTILASDGEEPFVSDDVSGDDCAFTTNPVLTVTFTNPHTSAGITLEFIGDYPSEMKLTWYDQANVKIIDKTFTPDSLKYFCGWQVENYQKLVIEFSKTRLPGQRIRLRYVRYGEAIDWTGDKIQSAKITEEVDVTSATLPINTAEISILDEANDFELTNHNGAWKSIQKTQSITLEEDTPNGTVSCGVFFVDTWKSSKNIINLSLVDRMGLMDRTKFYNGQIYSGVAAGTIIAAIMTSAGITAYTVDNETSAILLTGHIPICTHREALQQVVFACGAIATCARDGNISIRMPDRTSDATIGPSRKFMGTKVELADYVSGVSLTYTQYTLQSTASEIFKDTLPVGTSILEFDEPYDPTTLTVSAGTITEAKTNYIKVTMTSYAECTISGKKYESKALTYTGKLDVVEAGMEENIVSFDGCTLINVGRAIELTSRLLDYYQLRQIVDVRFLLEDEVTGDWVNIQDLEGHTAVTGITSQSIDLTGGFISEATCRGYSKVLTYFDYAGEMYAGEGIGVM